MSHVVIEGTFPAELPVREDGTPFPFSMATQSAAVFAETRTELVAQLVEGYDELPVTGEGDDTALWLRYKAAVALANMHQQVLAGDAVNAGTFDPSVEDEDTLTTIFTDRSEKIDEIPSWDRDLPLVLVASGFAPYTTTPRPAGNVLWIDPYTEKTFLDGVQALGLAEIFAAED
ncbi:hypothetical protein [Arthrobacter caoxuetaonis]|uniref:Uncharacterized protein n=1 Tax=Arthrobacter caoxuetaonis TaxID=2886935 RepID=A0A9X1MJR9_9MICC|nr:hypothetical protein [Arthrobacter caoxuetaonis]MCC3299824.1 hypothetical protein [Arthrobacter caoxuetaonis]USQ59276.1 hypothetical protein NF551_16970 [Arthrobacter caoxuetaonis]